MNLISIVAALLSARSLHANNIAPRRSVLLDDANNNLRTQRFVQAVAPKSKLARKQRIAEIGRRQTLRCEKASRRAAKAAHT